jgi:hypothetical protein
VTDIEAPGRRQMEEVWLEASRARVIDTLAVYATRYALGRKTYAVSDVTRALTARVTDLSENSKRCITEDIDMAEAEGRLGMDIDAKDWRALRDVLRGQPCDCGSEK